MEVHVTYFNREKQELAMVMIRNGGALTVIPIYMTFPEFRYLAHRLREIEEGILPKGNKSLETRS